MLPKEILQKIRRIEIQTRNLVNDVFSGEYHSVFKGRGMEFSEVREYQPGDSIRTIDWNVTARMGHPFVKKYVEERELTVILMVDASSSGQFGTCHKTKREIAAVVDQEEEEEIADTTSAGGKTSLVVLGDSDFASNAYFKDNQLGRAILFYERAKRLLPRDQDVAANLALANQLTVDKTITAKGSPLGRTLTWLARSGNIEELTRATFILYLITVALVVAAIWTREVGARKKLLAASFILGFLLIITGASLFGNIHQQRMVSWAIILTPAVDARSGPGDEYTKIFTIHEGTKVRMRQEREGWYLISLPNGLVGWIPEDVAEII